MIDAALYWTSQSLLLTDWAQTREIATNERYIETNMFLGKHPTLTEVNLWFGGALLMNYGIKKVDCDFMDLDDHKCSQLKAGYWAGAIIMQAANVINNKRIGIGFKF